MYSHLTLIFYPESNTQPSSALQNCNITMRVSSYDCVADMVVIIL
jgi:hypothetical protein